MKSLESLTNEIKEESKTTSSKSSRRNFFLGLMVPLSLSACHPQVESEKTARQFIEAYYVHINLKEAKNFTGGIAEEKISNQIKLTEGEMIQNTANLPKVDYKLDSKGEDSADGVSYIFEVHTNIKDIGHKKVYMKLRKVGENWKVTQFSEQQ